MKSSSLFVAFALAVGAGTAASSAGKAEPEAGLDRGEGRASRTGWSHGQALREEEATLESELWSWLRSHWALCRRGLGERRGQGKEYRSCLRSWRP